jgi:hypothetical protein
VYQRITSFLALFTSLGTLMCCALPALFVALGMGAAFAGLVTNVPQLVWMSENKAYLFAFGGIMLIAGGLLQWNARRLSCPTDPALGQACDTTRDWSFWIYYISLALYLIGAFFAYGIQYII